MQARMGWVLGASAHVRMQELMNMHTHARPQTHVQPCCIPSHAHAHPYFRTRFLTHTFDTSQQALQCSACGVLPFLHAHVRERPLTCVCMLTYAHAHIHTCPHTHMPTYTHAHIHTCPHAYMPTCPHAHMPTYTHTHVRTSPHTHMPTYTHAHIHTCPHAHIHTLRWHLSAGPAVLSLRETALTALQLLHALAALLPATEVDESGVHTVLEPLPKALRTLAAPHCLPKLCQVWCRPSVCAFVCLSVCVCACVYVCVHACLHACAQAHCLQSLLLLICQVSCCIDSVIVA